jgi:hypothetical protein
VLTMERSTKLPFADYYEEYEWGKSYPLEKAIIVCGRSNRWNLCVFCAGAGKASQC